MSKTIKKAITFSVIILLIIIVVISSFFIIRNLKNKAKIDNVIEIYSDDNVQDRIDNEDNILHDDIMLQLDGETVLGVIEIDKIAFKGLIYQGTSLETLANGVGHFENSPYLDGNVCLAAHNTNQYWAKLKNLQNGDKITYVSFLGTKEYQVFNSTKISETDWSLLENTDENILTLITCVKGVPSQRLCVQAKEVK